MIELPTDAPPGVAGVWRSTAPSGSSKLWRRSALALLALIVIVLVEGHALLSISSEGLESYSWFCPSCHA